MSDGLLVARLVARLVTRLGRLRRGHRAISTPPAGLAILARLVGRRPAVPVPVAVAVVPVATVPVPATIAVATTV
ncbi:MAG TPA: hypothetical protein VHM30_16340, partial [Gemmatimonadaceae bacterium]|nr:hypothetical protein [Gemmatimonadaceae bacterium]